MFSFFLACACESAVQITIPYYLLHKAKFRQVESVTHNMYYGLPVYAKIQLQYRRNASISDDVYAIVLSPRICGVTSPLHCFALSHGLCSDDVIKPPYQTSGEHAGLPRCHGITVSLDCDVCAVCDAMSQIFAFAEPQINARLPRVVEPDDERTYAHTT